MNLNPLPETQRIGLHSLRVVAAFESSSRTTASLVVLVCSANLRQGNAGAVSVGMKEAYTAISDCVAGMTKIIDEATREKTGGRFAIWEGGEFPW